MEIKFIDLFAGVGGFRLGLEKANKVYREYRQTETRNEGTRTPITSSQTTSKSIQHRRDFPNNIITRDTRQIQYSCVWTCEIDKHCRRTYRKQFGKCDIAHDITTVDVSRIPDFDLLCAGFPCQSFSIAGKRRGFDDTRGTLFFEICRVLQTKRPWLLLLENVKGLLSHDEGKTFLSILRHLEDLGYDCQWDVLNSKNFGVPQNRERVFIIGHLRGKPRFQVFPIGQDDRNVAESQTESAGSRERVWSRNYTGSLRATGSSEADGMSTLIQIKE